MKESSGGFTLGIRHRTWPYIEQRDGQTPMGFKIASHPLFSRGIETTISPLPALYTSKMLSRSFWNDPTIPRKSDNFFHRTAIISSKTVLHANQRITWEPLQVDHNKLSRGEFDPGEPEMGKWQLAVSDFLF
ncbi:hypothetical protein F5Y14DRAFT_413348 [Nemania sp. NC0429]|nr:hypothetical protein F5Y14DRAFT_413348 [Nemania sp. NC0429]